MVYKIKEFFKNIYYYFYHLPKRNKMKKLFNNYYSFDITDDIVLINFEMFKDFYENGQLEIVDWEGDDIHKEAKQNMDKIYFYISYFKPKYEKINDRLLDMWQCDIEWIDCDDYPGAKQLKFLNENDEYNNKIWKTHNNIENFLVEKDNYYLSLIIKIRKFLWT